MTVTKDSILTKRERDVLALAGLGLTNQEIANELFISTRTVKCTLHRACVRLGAHNRTQAVILAIRRGALHILDMFSADDLVRLLASLPPDLMVTVCQRAQQNNRYNGPPPHTARYEMASPWKRQLIGEMECVC